MDPMNASGELKALLERRAVALTQASTGFWHGMGGDALTAWEAFKELAVEPPENPVIWDGEPYTVSGVDSDQLLYEAGGREPRAEQPARYQFSVSRQFAMTGLSGEYAGMHHLMLTFEAPPDPELPFVQEWGEAGGPASAAWIATVERSAPFDQALKGGLVERFEFFESDI